MAEDFITDSTKEAYEYYCKAMKYHNQNELEGALINFLLSLNTLKHIKANNKLTSTLTKPQDLTCYSETDYKIKEMDTSIEKAMNNIIQYVKPLQEQLKVVKYNAKETKKDVACKDIKQLVIGEDDMITFDDISGQEIAKNQIKNGILYPLLYPRLYPNLAKGILFYGAPGTGKTLLAKAFVNQLQIEAIKSETDVHIILFAPKGSDLKGKYVGESEKKIETLFKCASQKASVCTNELDENPFDKSKIQNKVISVIFIDEIDAIARSRDKDESGIMSNTVNALLQEMDGVAGNPNVVVMAATNYPWKLDEAVLRRFDSKVYVKLPDVPDIVQQIKTEIYNKFIRKALKQPVNIKEKKVESVIDEGMKCAHGGRPCADNTVCLKKFEQRLNKPKPWEIFDFYRQHHFPLFTDDQIRRFAVELNKNYFSGGDISNICKHVFKTMGTKARINGRFVAMPMPDPTKLTREQIKSGKFDYIKSPCTSSDFNFYVSNPIGKKMIYEDSNDDEPYIFLTNKTTQSGSSLDLDNDEYDYEIQKGGLNDKEINILKNLNSAELEDQMKNGELLKKMNDNTDLFIEFPKLFSNKDIIYHFIFQIMGRDTKFIENLKTSLSKKDSDIDTIVKITIGDTSINISNKITNFDESKSAIVEAYNKAYNKTIDENANIEYKNYDSELKRLEEEIKKGITNPIEFKTEQGNQIYEFILNRAKYDLFSKLKSAMDLIFLTSESVIKSINNLLESCRNDSIRAFYLNINKYSKLFIDSFNKLNIDDNLALDQTGKEDLIEIMIKQELKVPNILKPFKVDPVIYPVVYLPDYSSMAYKLLSGIINIITHKITIKTLSALGIAGLLSYFNISPGAPIVASILSSLGITAPGWVTFLAAFLASVGVVAGTIWIVTFIYNYLIEFNKPPEINQLDLGEIDMGEKIKTGFDNLGNLKNYYNNELFNIYTSRFEWKTWYNPLSYGYKARTKIYTEEHPEKQGDRIQGVSQISCLTDFEENFTVTLRRGSILKCLAKGYLLYDEIEKCGKGSDLLKDINTNITNNSSYNKKLNDTILTLNRLYYLSKIEYEKESNGQATPNLECGSNKNVNLNLFNAYCFENEKYHTNNDIKTHMIKISNINYVQQDRNIKEAVDTFFKLDNVCNTYGTLPENVNKKNIVDHENNLYYKDKDGKYHKLFTFKYSQDLVKLTQKTIQQLKDKEAAEKAAVTPPIDTTPATPPANLQQPTSLSGKQELTPEMKFIELYEILVNKLYTKPVKNITCSAGKIKCEGNSVIKQCLMITQLLGNPVNSIPIIIPNNTIIELSNRTTDEENIKRTIYTLRRIINILNCFSNPINKYIELFKKLTELNTDTNDLYTNISPRFDRISKPNEIQLNEINTLLKEVVDDFDNLELKCPSKPPVSIKPPGGILRRASQTAVPQKGGNPEQTQPAVPQQQQPVRVTMANYKEHKVELTSDDKYRTLGIMFYSTAQESITIPVESLIECLEEPTEYKHITLSFEIDDFKKATNVNNSDSIKPTTGSATVKKLNDYSQNKIVSDK